MRSLHRNYRAVTAPTHFMEIHIRQRTVHCWMDKIVSVQTGWWSACWPYKCILDLLTTTHFDNIWNMPLPMQMQMTPLLSIGGSCACPSVGRVSCSFRYLITFQCSFCGQPLDPTYQLLAPSAPFGCTNLLACVCAGTLTLLFHLLSNSRVDGLVTGGCPYR